jgi:hypothetical protein
MTVGKLIELLAGKAGVHSGVFKDATVIRCFPVFFSFNFFKYLGICLFGEFVGVLFLRELFSQRLSVVNLWKF